MRKSTKWAVILGTAAVMTFGASLTSSAAKGWVIEYGTWYYYLNEQMVVNSWQTASDGKWYFLGEDGAMTTNTWIDWGKNRYYTTASGIMASNEWKYTYGLDDDSEEKSWYWFDDSGKMAAGKKLSIGGQDYYFGADGKMLTGWINTEGTPEAATSFVPGKVTYTNKNGIRIRGFIKLYAPGDTDEDEETKSWYNITDAGAARSSEKVVLGNQTYIFDKEGRMLSGWVKSTGTTSKPEFEAVQSLENLNYSNIYYAGAKDDGSVKTAGWFYAVGPTGDIEDPNEERFWYYIKNGTLVTNSNNVAANAQVEGVQLSIGENSTTNETGTAVGILQIGTASYGFNSEGKMISGLWRFINVPKSQTSYAVANYYFGKHNDGSMKTGAVTLTDEDSEMSYDYYFSAAASTLGRGTTGVQSEKLYDAGLVVRANEDSLYGAAIVAGKAYIVNETGKVMTSTSAIYTSEYGITYKNIGGKVYYTTDETTPTTASAMVVSGIESDILHYESK